MDAHRADEPSPSGVAGRYRAGLRTAVAGEARAYGFTLVVWTTGALCTAERGLPGRLGAVAYPGGVLLAMTLVVLGSFGRPGAIWKADPRPRYAFGAVHIVSVMAATAAGWGAAALVPSHAPAFLAAGFTAALLFQLLLGAEVAMSLAPESDEAGSHTGASARAQGQ